MAQKLGRDYLRRSARNQGMLKSLRDKKTEQRQAGERVLFHKFIKKVHPNYKFYKFHATLIQQLQKVIDGECNRLILQVPPRTCLLYTSPSPRDLSTSRMPSSA